MLTVCLDWKILEGVVILLVDIKLDHVLIVEQENVVNMVILKVIAP